MSSFDELVQSVSNKYHTQIRKQCSDLFNQFNLNDFFHYKLNTSGHFNLFACNIEWCEFFSANEFYKIDPYFRHPEFFHNGIALLQNIDDESILKTLNKDKYDANSALLLMNKVPDGLEVFGFVSNTANEKQTALMLSELPLLRTFAKHFKEHNPTIFSKLQDNQIDLIDLIGPRFYENALNANLPLKKKKQLLENLGFESTNPLSPREVDVTRLLLKGYSATRIAKEMFRSRRTVEHHLERIKEKLGCDSKAELIEKANRLEIFHPFD